MLDPRRSFLAALLALSVGAPLLAQEKDPKQTDEVLRSQTPPAAKPVDDAKSVPHDDPKDSAPPTEESEGKRLLRQSAQAIRAARSISYSARAFSTGALESLTPKSDGVVKMRRVANGAPDAWLARITGRTTKKGGKTGEGEALDFDVAYLGNKRIEWSDVKAQKIIEKPDRSAQSPIVQGAKGLRIDELFAAGPFARDLAGGTATILDRKTIAGVECEVVQVEIGERKNKARWYLGVDDHIPRRVDRVIEGAMASEVVVETSDMKVETSEDPSISAASLRIPIQPGWTEEREPIAAPPPVPTPTAVSSDPKGDPASGKVDHATALTIPAPIAPAAPPPPRVAPDFELTSTKGDKVTLQALRDGGTQAIVLDFFGPWSLLARDWQLHLDDVAKRFADQKVRVLALSVRAKNNEDSVNMTKDFTFTTLLNADKVAKDYAIRVYPTTVVINQSGEIVRTLSYSKEDLSEALAAAIEEAITGQKAPSKTDAAKPAETSPTEAPSIESENAEKEKAAEEGKVPETKKDK